VTGRQAASNGTGPARPGPVPAAAEFPDPADTLGPLELPHTWQARAELLEGLLRSHASARSGVTQVYGVTFAVTAGTDGQRTQAAKLAAADAQLCADRIHARLTAYKLLLDVARDGTSDVTAYSPAGECHGS
jgi:hypothetical protein